MPLTATIAPATQRRGAPRRARRVLGAAARPSRSSSAQRRPARRAGVRLGVEAPVGRVLVLGPAGRAHLEAGHRRQRPVVRDAAHDREARAAVRAVDERVAVAAVAPGRTAPRRQSSQVAVSGADARARLAAARRSRGSRSRARRSGASASVGDALDARQRRRLARQPRRGTRSTASASPSTSSSTPRASLSTQPARPSSLGEPVDVGPEADALDRPLDARADAARACRPGARSAITTLLDQLAQHVVRARLRLLDPRDVLASA